MDQSTGTVGRSGMGTRKITLGQRENKLDSCISTRISPLEHVVQLQLAPSRYSLSTKPFTSQELWKVPFNVKQVQWLGQVWSMLLRSLILISRPNHSPNKTAIMNPHRTLALTGTLGMEFFYFQRVDLFTLRGKSRSEGHRDVRQANETDPVAFLRKWPSKAMKAMRRWIRPSIKCRKSEIQTLGIQWERKMNLKTKTNNENTVGHFPFLRRIQVEVVAEGNDFVVGSTGWWMFVLAFRKDSP